MLTIDVPRRTFLVIWYMAPRVENDSRPQDSGTHNESTFSCRSAILAHRRISRVESKGPRLYPNFSAVIIFLLPSSLWMLLRCTYENYLSARNHLCISQPGDFLLLLVKVEQSLIC